LKQETIKRRGLGEGMEKGEEAEGRIKGELRGEKFQS
jgi:hypothetical protein